MNTAKIQLIFILCLSPILGISQNATEPLLIPYQGRVVSNEQCDKLLNMQLIPQVQSKWCYAACTEMVLKFYNKPVEQCQIAKQLMGTTTRCCDSISCLSTEHKNDACNTLLPTSKNKDWLNFIKLQGIELAGSTLENIDYDKIKANLDKCQPVIALFHTGVESHADVFHAVVIVGYVEICQGWLRKTCHKFFLGLNPLKVCQGCKFLIEYDENNNKFISHSDNHLYATQYTDNHKVSVILIKP